VAARRVLIVEDEPDIRDLLVFHLERDGYQVAKARNGTDALRQAQASPPDLVLLDLMLPEMDGLEVCRRLRQNPVTQGIPIVMLTARGDEVDRVLGLEMGADDYVVKPFSPRELVARVRAVLRRVESAKQSDHPPVYDKGGLKIDFTTYEVFVRGRSVKLTLKEFELLRFLVQNPNRVLSRDQLLDRVWGGETFVTPRTVDVHIRRLRKAIEKDDSKPEWILTLRGVGYKFDEKALEQ